VGSNFVEWPEAKAFEQTLQMSGRKIALFRSGSVILGF
jgi:hypothetical protein